VTVRIGAGQGSGLLIFALARNDIVAANSCFGTALRSANRDRQSEQSENEHWDAHTSAPDQGF
jgi:hypothetical protein